MQIKKVIFISSAAVTMAFGMNAFASTQMLNQGFYVGVQAGYANMNYKKSWLTDNSNIASVGSVDKSGFSGRFFGGYNFTPYVAVEVGYLMLPKVKFNNILLSGQTVRVDESFRQSIFDAVVKGTLPLSDGYDLYAKAGYASVHRDDLEASSGGVTVQSNTDNVTNVPVVGAGASYHFTQNVIADISYMRYFNSGDLEATDFGGAGVIYQFG